MKLSELKPAVGSKHDKFRKGRGHGSETGRPQVRNEGTKGSFWIAENRIRRWSNAYRRIPKRGFIIEIQKK